MWNTQHWAPHIQSKQENMFINKTIIFLFNFWTNEVVIKFFFKYCLAQWVITGQVWVSVIQRLHSECLRACWQAGMHRSGRSENISWFLAQCPAVTKWGERRDSPCPAWPTGSVLIQTLHCLSCSNGFWSQLCGKSGWGQEKGNPETTDNIDTGIRKALGNLGCCPNSAFF